MNTFILVFLIITANISGRCFQILEVESYELQARNLSSSFCLKSWTCLDNTSDIMNLCFCDDLCHIYGDCCTDVPPTRTVVPKEVTFNCEYVSKINERSFIFIVRSCPTSSPDELKSLCGTEQSEDITLQTPVTGLKSGYLFANMYCAMCHSEDYELWKPGLNCGWKFQYTGNYNISELQNNEDCYIIFNPSSPYRAARECMPVVDTCSDDSMNSKCQEAERSLVFGSAVYRNTYCGECNEELLSNLSCSPLGLQIIPGGDKRNNNINYSYKLLIDLNTLKSTETTGRRRRLYTTENDILQHCNTDEIYDPFSESCRRVFCSPPFVYNNSKCILGLESKPMNNDSHLACPHIRLNESEFKLINGSEVLELSSGMVYGASESFIGIDFVLVCIKHGYHATDNSDKAVTLIFTSAESVLSVVCESLSILCLFLGLTVYICIPKLHNVPGRNLICLMSSLLIAQMFFIMAPLAVGAGEACVAMAVIIHYMFLAAFFWMNVMAVDMFTTFSKGFVNSRGEAKHNCRRFSSYCLYAWALPACIVMVALILDLSSTADARPQYGRLICWFGSDKGLLYFFLIPIFLLVFLNIICFVATARSIYKTDKSTSKILRKKRSCKLLIYVKLSIVMGLTWLFACIAVFVDAPALWYMFVIFNALQGVFIFASFVCSSKIFRMVSSSSKKLFSRSYSYFTNTGFRNSSSSGSSMSNKTVLSVITHSSKRNTETAC